MPQQKLLCSSALYYRKSLQPDSVTLPSVGSGGLRGSKSETLPSPAPASLLSQGATEPGCLKLNLRKDCITPSRMLFLCSFAKLIHISSALTSLILLLDVQLVEMHFSMPYKMISLRGMDKMCAWLHFGQVSIKLLSLIPAPVSFEL